MQYPRPSINEILEEHVRGQLDGKVGLRRKRVETAERHLRRCLDEVGEAAITDASRSILELERLFCPDDAFGRILNAGDLLYVLNAYVSEPWLLGDLRDRAVQLRFADALETLIRKRRLTTFEEFAGVEMPVLMAIIQAKSALSIERMRAR
jgi:hypothetical protein